MELRGVTTLVARERQNQRVSARHRREALEGRQVLALLSTRLESGARPREGRHPVQRPVRLALGLATVHRYLLHPQRLRDELARVPAALQAPLPDDEAQEPRRLETWVVSDESSAGLCVRTRRPGLRDLRVGDLVVAFETSAGRVRHQLALIRWMRAGTGAVAVGLQKFPGVLAPATCRSHLTSPALAALLLRDPRLPWPLLVAERELLTRGARLVVEHAGKGRPVRIGETLMESTCLRVVRFSGVAPIGRTGVPLRG
jgi:hypothetical protein